MNLFSDLTPAKFQADSNSFLIFKYFGEFRAGSYKITNLVKVRMTKGKLYTFYILTFNKNGQKQ